MTWVDVLMSLRPADLTTLASGVNYAEMPKSQTMRTHVPAPAATSRRARGRELC